MHSRRIALLGSAVLLALCACEWNLWGTVVRPTVEDRVRESLSGALPAPDSVAVNPDSFCFAVFGDPQIGHDFQTSLARFKEEAAERGMDFFCVLGDLTNDATPEECDSIKAQLDRVGIPYYATIGNHDLYQADGWERFKQDYGPSCYAVAVADRIKLVFLDTADGTIGLTQFDWFESELQDTLLTRIVLTHFPVFDGERPVMWRLASGAERVKVQSLLERYGAYAWCAGHIHGWRHMQVGSVNHFTCGSMAPGTLDYGNPGYLLFRFAHGSLSWQFVELD
ncbi:metallophosphoesterase [candidate division WOR-3 bacterium]|nr:metallophosphoesterase [candidate division WOR-3 bacterium]